MDTNESIDVPKGGGSLMLAWQVRSMFKEQFIFEDQFTNIYLFQTNMYWSSVPEKLPFQE